MTKEREMLDSFRDLETTLELCDRAKIKKRASEIKRLLSSLDSCWYKFNGNFQIYKADTLKKSAKTETVFNSSKLENAVEVPLYEFNDVWRKQQFEKYGAMRDELEEIDEGFEVQSQGVVTLVAGDLEQTALDIFTEVDVIDTAVTRLETEINGITDGKMSASMVTDYKENINRLSLMINQDLKNLVHSKLSMSGESSKPEYSNENIRQTINKRSFDWKLKLNELYLNLAKKSEVKITEEAKFSLSPDATADMSTPMTVPRRNEQVFLEKTKPPRFDGSELEFPEFQRKWKAQVNKAGLPEETELDKLRDSLPKQGKDMLYGVTTLEEAWKILGHRFGNKDLISKKLKEQLKNIACEGKNDPERLMDLKIKVRNIVNRLETMKLEAALQYDPEFLSAIYNALPERYKMDWLKVANSDDQWSDMLTFLDNTYERALKELTLLSHVSGASKKVKSNAVDVSKDNNDGGLYLKAKDAAGKCSICKGFHTFKKAQGKDAGKMWPSDRFITCKKFRDMNVVQRAKAIQDVQGCPRCTSWGHKRDDCKAKPNSCGEDQSGVKCQGDHSRLVHGSGNVYCAAISSKSTNSRLSTKKPIKKACLENSNQGFDCVNESEETIFYVQTVPVKGCASARLFWDRGSNRVLIREAYAKENKLASLQVVYNMETVGNESRQIIGNIHVMDLLDRQGQVRTIWGYSVPTIMTHSSPDLSHLQSSFPHVPAEALSQLACGEIDVLVGLNFNELQPDVEDIHRDKVGGIIALKSIFGCGYVLGGHHDGITSNPEISPVAALVRVAKLKIVPEPSFTPEFWEAESMGVLPPPRCSTCMNCLKYGSCSERHQSFSAKKQAELELIESKMEIRNGEVWCSYPYTKDPSCLPDNRNSVLRIAQKVEKGLIKDGLHSVYNDQIQSQLDRGVAVKLSKEELSEWSGPYQYISHHGVLKDSKTTPLRVVTNSSLNNGGNSLNSCIASGPNSLNPMLDVMIRFRTYEVAIQYDLSKAYNTLRTGPVEKHLRRFIWRFDPSQEWQEYALDRVHFGDACAATQLEVAKNLVAEKGKQIDPEAAKRIKHDMYVDDGLTGCRRDQISRFVGEKQSDGIYSGSIQKILKLGNFSIKAFGVSGTVQREEDNLMGSKVLGYGYNIQSDMLSVMFRINVSRKKRSVREFPDLTIEDVNQLKCQKLSKRILLGITNSFGDFLGIASPFTIRFKDEMRKLFLLEEPLNWDDEVPENYKDQWINLIVEALETGSLDFPRSTRPANAAPDVGPTVVGCSDFGSFGYDARVYLRWKLSDSSLLEDSYAATLAICKARVPPLSGLTVPRGELTALTLQSRLMLIVVLALQKLETPPISAIMLVDSKVAMAAVKSKRVLAPYFQNRTAEILDNMSQTSKYCAVEEIHHIESALNPSDLSTKPGCLLSELGPGSFHQTGPDFFSWGRDLWPVSAQFDTRDIPVEELKVRDKLVFTAAARSNFCFSQEYEGNPWKAVESILHYSNSLPKVRRIIARYLNGLQAGIRKNSVMSIDNPVAHEIVARWPKKHELETAEKLILLHGMVYTVEALNQGKLKTLLPYREGKLIMTRGRLNGESLERILGVSQLPILMPESRVAYLFMVHAHRGEFGYTHRSVMSTLARSRNYVWVVKGRQLAKKVVNECAMCDRTRKELLMQQMADVREETLTVSPPWMHICLDFAGPILVKDQVKKRTKLKAWILVYTCRSTKAVCLLCCPGYSTEDFLVKHSEFVARCGVPSTIVSDKGSQLVAAGNIVANQDLPCNKYNWERIISATSSSTWTFVPAKAQHRNGLAESTVKVMKKSLSLALGPGVELTYPELVTLLTKIGYIQLIIDL